MRKIFLALMFALAIYACKQDSKKEAETAPIVKEAATPPPVEMVQGDYMQKGQQMLRNFETGDIEKWAEHFAENTVYIWSAGDSLTGKQAVISYWEKRRAEVIDSIQFSNDIWLPIKVNQPQRGPDLPGIWLLSWYQVNVKYKSGKKLSFWVHHDYHFNDEGKIDRSVQYIDRAPINAASRS